MTAEEMKSGFMKFDKELLCGILASILYQLAEHGIKFNGYEEKPDTIKIVADDKIEFIPGLPNDRLEYRAKLDFYGFENEPRSSNEALIYYFEKEIEAAECAKAEEARCFNGVPCNSIEQARKLFDAYKTSCEFLIKMIKDGSFEE